ncbi:MAG: prephenate dehydratase [Lentisphaerae bacterium]|nr:prephenate dehydratase [Lentisphaerota bacterium]
MNPPILYLGPEGTHSHEAAARRFGSKARLIPCLTHPEIFARLCATRTNPRPLAVVPVENSTEGPVTQTLDQLAHHPKVSILDSFSMPVRNHLMARPGVRTAEIRRVCSHPQALGQCRQTLERLLPRAEAVPESSTAAAARRAADEPGTAAIAAAAAARLHGLSILRKNVQDGEENVTRFFTLTTRRPVSAPKLRKRRSLIYLVVGNRPGALLHVLAPFDASGINLTFIQSRPLPGRPWEYGFFIEAVTDWSTAPARAAWQLVRALSESSRQIGTYPAG